MNIFRVIVNTMLCLWLVSCKNNASIPSPISRVSSNRSPLLGNREGNSIGSNIQFFYNRSYTSISKGSYNGNSYIVKRGDTLFYISWITGNNFLELARRNNIPAPYTLRVGQKIQFDNKLSNLDNKDTRTLLAKDAIKTGIPVLPDNSQMQILAHDSNQINTYFNHSDKKNILLTAPVSSRKPSFIALEENKPIQSSSVIGCWRWPVNDGIIINNFSSSEGGNKGIDISAPRGRPILASADGSVVYAGNALQGYGNLVIIKHNDDYLSAYAHNEKILVREQQKVKAGQKVATMGSTGTNSVRLHFEIRYKGKSVNPIRFLSQR